MKKKNKLKNDLKIMIPFLIVILLVIGLVIIYDSMLDPVIDETKINEELIESTYQKEGYTITEKVVEVRHPASKSNIRGWTYYLNYEIKHNNKIEKGFLNFKCMFCFSIFKHIMKPKSNLDFSYIDNKYIYSSNNQGKKDSVFDKDVVTKLNDLNSRNIWVSGSYLNDLIITENRIEIRLNRVKSADELDLNTIKNSYGISSNDQTIINELLVNMVKNIEEDSNG